MTEKNLNKKKNGIAVLLLSFVIYAVSIYGLIYKSGVLFGISLFFVCTTWLLWPGLKVIQPQEALVLWEICRYTQRAWILFCESVLLVRESCVAYEAETERGSE